MAHAKACISARALGICIALCGVASAQDEHLATARKLANDGINAIVAGDCDAGLPLVRRAEEIHHALVHQRYIAQCLAQSGKLVGATELWRQMIREGASPGASAAVHDAVAHARAQLDETLPKLGSTTVSLAERYPDPTLLLDGQAMSTTLLEAPQVLDPGDHILEVSARDYDPRVYRWTLPPGGQSAIVVHLEPNPASAAPVSTPPSKDAAPAGSSGAMTTWGIVIGATGLAAIVAGTSAWIVKEEKEAKLASMCDDSGLCFGLTEDEFESEQQTILSLTTATVVLNLGGSLLAAAGVGMIVLDNVGNDAPEASAASQKRHVRVAVGASPGGAHLGLAGRF